jgi:hypothetical protein
MEEDIKFVNSVLESHCKHIGHIGEVMIQHITERPKNYPPDWEFLPRFSIAAYGDLFSYTESGINFKSVSVTADTPLETLGNFIALWSQKIKPTL